MNKYLELDRLEKIKEQSQLCGDFLKWLQTKYRMLNKRESFNTEDVVHIAYYYSSPINISELLAEFFDIDLNEIENEKEQMLKELSNKEEKKPKIHKCKECIDCQQMIGLGGVSYRCYGYVAPLHYEIKKDITKDDKLPETSPEWCPRKEWDK
jgi:hypothetical protein